MCLVSDHVITPPPYSAAVHSPTTWTSDTLQLCRPPIDPCTKPPAARLRACIPKLFVAAPDNVQVRTSEDRGTVWTTKHATYRPSPDERDVINIITDRTMDPTGRTVDRLYTVEPPAWSDWFCRGTVLPEGGATLIKDQLGGLSASNERPTVNDSGAAGTFRHFNRAGSVPAPSRWRQLFEGRLTALLAHTQQTSSVSAAWLLLRWYVTVQCVS